jgi:hypothetical protein
MREVSGVRKTEREATVERPRGTKTREGENVRARARAAYKQRIELILGELERYVEGG